jgi:hypothetical protein
MKITQYPAAVWTLQPGFKPVQVVLISRYYEGWHATSSGKTYHESKVFALKEEAISFGRSEIDRMRADIEKRAESIDKKSAALDKASA